MAQHNACTVLQARESKSFNLRVNYSATKHLSGDDCIDIDVSIPAGAGFTCTAKYWPNWHSTGCICIMISVVITHRTDDQHRHKLLAAHIDLPARTGFTPPPVTVLPARTVLTPPPVTMKEPVTTDCKEDTVKVKREHVTTADCKEDVVKPEPATSDDCKESMVKREPAPVTVTTDYCCREGISLIAKRSDVEASCVVEGHFTAICMVTVSKHWPPLPLPTPSKLDLDILKASDLTDVSFQVDGETVRAHRLVLAARSPVFRSELFGQTAAAEGHGQQEQTASSIAIQDMKASTFKSMLHYMYHGVLPAVAPEETTCLNSETQNLYVAADRYGLDMLRQTCEEVLCARVSKDTVLSNLQFAEERACLKLRSRCLDFLAISEKFKAVAVTNEYIDLMNKSPSLLDQVQNRFKKRPRLS